MESERWGGRDTDRGIGLQQQQGGKKTQKKDLSYQMYIFRDYQALQRCIRFTEFSLEGFDPVSKLRNSRCVYSSSSDEFQYFLMTRATYEHTKLSFNRVRPSVLLA